jgi:hypothetical protein
MGQLTSQSMSPYHMVEFEFRFQGMHVALQVIGPQPIAGMANGSPFASPNPCQA